MHELSIELFLSTMRLSAPILLVACGGLLSEKSGVANIALEANLMFSAFAAAAVAAATSSAWLGLMAGMAGGMAAAGIFAAVCIWGRGDQIVVGTAFNLLAVGSIPILCRSLFGQTGSTPSLPALLTFHQSQWFFLFALMNCLFCHWLLANTRHGLRIIAAGENPDALTTQGVNYRWVRWRAVTEGGVLVGLGGVCLSLCESSGYVREMSAGRGFIALAALIFGGWKPVPTAFACLFFAFADAVQIQLQGQMIGGTTVPNQFIQILPYVVTLAALAFSRRRILPPAAINRY